MFDGTKATSQFEESCDVACTVQDYIETESHFFKSFWKNVTIRIALQMTLASNLHRCFQGQGQRGHRRAILLLVARKTTTATIPYRLTPFSSRVRVFPDQNVLVQFVKRTIETVHARGFVSKKTRDIIGGRPHLLTKTEAQQEHHDGQRQQQQ